MVKYGDDLDLYFAALSDPTRRAILERLARGPATVSELSVAHDMALPSFMGHLRKLEAAGLVTSAKKGRTRTFTLAPDAFLPAQDWLQDQQATWTARLDQFDTYVATLIKDKADEP